jgi:hypothetical protein
MIKKLLLIILLSTLLFITKAEALEIKDLHLDFSKGDIKVSFVFDPGSDRLNEIREGIPKVIIFYIDLFRSWDIWPDEFINGKKIIIHIKGDPVKKEFIGSSFDGKTLKEERFKSFESMIKWASTFNKISITNMKGLDSGKYFARITVESRIREIPSLVSEIFFFLPTKEFKISSDSEMFLWDQKTGKATVLKKK